MGKTQQNNLENFDQVWERVIGADSASPSPEETLRSLIDEERSSHMLYATMAKHYFAPFRSIILKIASDEARHLRELQLEHFLLSGKSYSPTDSAPKSINEANALRAAYLKKKKTGARYLAAAEQEKSDRSALFRRIAGEELGHAEALRRIIEKTVKYR